MPERVKLEHALRERVKEAAAIHEVARLVRETPATVHELLECIAAAIPPAFQYPDVCAARATHGADTVMTPGFAESGWTMREEFATQDGTRGRLDVVYSERRPDAADGPFLDEERRLLRSMADVLCAILDRRNAERALHETSEHFRLAQKSAGMGIWDWNFLNDRVTWSAELETIAGLPPGGFGGTLDHYRAIVHPDDIEGSALAIQRALHDPACDGVYEAEMRLMRPDGSYRWVVSTGRVLRDDNGAPVRMLGMAHDVTGWRQLEQQFLEAQKMDALGRLAGGVAHDFNNLLTAISGYAEIVMNDLAEDDPCRNDVAEIAGAADRASALTRQLLAFSRRQVLAPRFVDPNDIVSGMEKLLRRVIGTHIELRTLLDDAAGTVRVDPGQLEQVIMNLAVNARDAMSDGGTLTIATSSATFDERVQWHKVELHAGEYVVIAVTDTGTGMSEETKARLFEPFFTTKEKERGTGLGLATVYGIVQQSGGAVWVYTEEGRGSTFKVYLPRAGERAAPLDEPAQSAVALEGTETVVLVDDDDAVRTLAERALRNAGYDVICAANAAAALSLLEERDFDARLLVADVFMPVMQGPELAAHVLVRNPDIRILFVTGYSEETLDVGQYDTVARVLEKPFTPTRLLREIRTTLDA